MRLLVYQTWSINYRMNCTSLLALNDKSQVYRGTNTLTMLNMVCVDFYSRYDTLKNDLLIKAINRSPEVVLGLKDLSSSRKASPASKGLAPCWPRFGFVLFVNMVCFNWHRTLWLHYLSDIKMWGRGSFDRVQYLDRNRYSDPVVKGRG